MKSKKNLSVVFLILSMFMFQDLAFADAETHVWNKCKNSRRNKLKIKVNGPGSGCPKEKIKEKLACTQTSGLEVVENFRMEDGVGNPTCTCTPSSTSFHGAWAKAQVGPNLEFSDSWKTNSCKHFKAGGRINEAKLEKGFYMPALLPPPPPLVDGGVQATLQSGSHTYNYLNNTITLNDLSGKLSINSFDLINEYSIMSIKVAIITVDDSGIVLTEDLIYETGASYINGSLVFSGDPGGLSSSDFTANVLDSGINYSLDEISGKVLELGTDIDSSMLIDVIFTTDVGNLLDDEPELLSVKSPLKLLASLSSKEDIVNIDLMFLENSEKNEGLQKTPKSVDAEIVIRDMQGKIIYNSERIELINGEAKKLLISTMNVNKNNFYLVILKASNGYVRTKLLLL